MRATRTLSLVRRARLRQLRGRLLAPLGRRVSWTPRRRSPVSPLFAGVDLWRTPAFAGADTVAGAGSVDLLGTQVRYPPLDWSLPDEPRLRRFHLHYGDEILGWARRGDAAAAAAGLRAWIAGNPPSAGDAWHPYPLSTRVANWLAAGALLPELVDEDVADSLWRQLVRLRRTVEHGVLGNHVIRNAKALVLGGVAFGDGALTAQGLRLLRREVAEQVLPDGGHYERSPLYHGLVLRDLLEVRAVAEDAAWLDAPIAAMRGFAAALARPDGLPFPFNDAPLELAAALELPPAPDGLAGFPETGYAVIRAGAIVVAFDCGPPAPDFLPAHAHADALSFQAWVGDEPVVVDPGTFTYEAGPDRDAYRGTAAHATLMVDGRDQFELWGAFRTGPLPRVRLRSLEPPSAEVELHGGVRHVRTLELADGVLHVRDTVSGRGTHRLRSTLPLASERWLAHVAYEGPVPLRQTTVRHSPRLYAEESLPALVAEGDARLPAHLVWHLNLGDGC
jgi:hypothetical protein